MQIYFLFRMDAVAAFSNQHSFDYCPVKVVLMDGFADFFKYAANLGFSRIGKYFEIKLVRAQANSGRYKR